MPGANETSPLGELITGIYQDVHKRSQSGPVSTSGDLFAKKDRETVIMLHWFLHGLSPDALAGILDEGFDSETKAKFGIADLLGPEHLTALKVNSLVLPHYIEAQNQTVWQELDGKFRVWKLENAEPSALEQPTPTTTERVAGPVTGTLRRPYVEVGTFGIRTPRVGRHKHTKPVYVRPLNRAGEGQIGIEKVT